MGYKRYKIYPAPLPGGLETPTLDPSKAPWSSPRGFATSIPEEVAAYKRAVKADKPTPQPLLIKPHKQKKPRHLKLSCPGFIKKALWAIYNHFQAITFSEERHDHINDRMHRFIGTVCCIRADVIASLQSPERNINSPQSL